MFTFKDDIVNSLTDEDRFDLITVGCLREPYYDFGTKLVIADDPENMIKYEVEYLSKECSLENARMLWCWNLETNQFVVLPDDPLVTEESDEGYQTESYLKLKQDIAEGNYPSDLSALKSPEEFKLLMPKLMEDGLITFDRETGSYNFSEEFKKAMAEKKSKVDEPA